jgi:hypothetical protein
VNNKPLIEAASPAPKLTSGKLVLHRHTWFQHVKPNHPDVFLGNVRQAMNDPCEIAQSKTVPGTYLLLNNRALNSAGQTLRVPFKPLPDGTNLVTSAYFSDATGHGKIVWRRGDG